MAQPFESREFLETQKWRIKSRSKKLNSSECISIWTDICGFGYYLRKNNWDLNRVQRDGMIELLNEVYNVACRVSLPNCSPLPMDKILVLNDGIAKTVDLKYKSKIDGYLFLRFLLDTLINHYFLLHITQRFNVGIRTVLAGGERIQYSPEKITGQSLLYYDEDNISEFGKKILDTQYLYNPAEFQMNTAFAKAFTIDQLGSEEGINVNGLFIEQSFMNLIDSIPNLNLELTNKSWLIYYKNTLMFQLNIINRLEKTIKGLDVKIFHIEKLVIFKEFDGDDVEFYLYINRKSS